MTPIARLTPLLSIAQRDLRVGYRELGLLMLCVMLSMAVITSVCGMIQSVRSGIADQATTILGGDVELNRIYYQVPVDVQDYVKSQGEMSTVIEMRTMASDASGQHRTMVEFKGVSRNYPLVGDVKLRDGAPFPGVFNPTPDFYGAVVEERLLRALHIQQGDLIRIGQMQFQVRAVIESEPDRAGNMAFGIGPRVMTSLEGLRDSELLEPGALLYYRYRVKLPENTTLDAWKQHLQSRFPGANWTLRDSRDASPSLTDALQRVFMFFSATALLTLLAAGIGIAHAAQAFLHSKQSTIAMLRCLGASKTQVGVIFGWQLLRAGALSILTGIIAGVLLQQLLLPQLASMIPIKPANTLNMLQLLTVIAFGFCALAVFSLIPLVRAAHGSPIALFRSISQGTTATDDVFLPPLSFAILLALMLGLARLAVMLTGEKTLTLYIYAGSIAALGLFTALAYAAQRAARMLSHRSNLRWRWVWGSIARSGQSTRAIITSLGMGLSLLVTIGLVAGNLHSQLSEGLPSRAPSYFLIDIQKMDEATLGLGLKAIPGVQSVTMMPMLRGRIAALNGQPVKPEAAAQSARWALRSDRGLTFSAALPANSRVVEGKWWPADYRGAPLVSFDAKLAHAMGLKLGDAITFTVLDREITATIANLRDISWGTFEMNFTTVFTPNALQDLPYTMLATIHADATSDAPLEDFLAANYPAVTLIRTKEILAQLLGILDQISLSIMITAWVSIGCAVLVVASAIRGAYAARMPELMVLRVLGAQVKQLLRLSALELALLGLLCALVAAGIGLIASYGLTQRMILDHFSAQPQLLAQVTALGLLICIGAGWWFCRRALRQSALPYLRNE